MKPLVDRISLNVDGSAINNPSVVGFGGMIRNHNGDFILGYSGSMSISNILCAELVALLRGLALCWDQEFHRVKC